MKRECSTENGFSIYVGLDWGTEFHQACVLDVNGKIVHESKIGHNGQALADFVRLMVDTAGGKPDRVAVAIEVPRGPVVEAFLEGGCPVFSINPEQLDRFRDRYTAAGAKDDRRDAYVAADSLRTDQHCFRRVAPLTLMSFASANFPERKRASVAIFAESLISFIKSCCAIIRNY